MQICRWEMCGQVKVVVKIESEDDMLVLQVKFYCYESRSCLYVDF